MTESDLIKANALKSEIDELEMFIRKAEKVWTGKIIKKDITYILKSSAYGAFSESAINLNTQLKNKVLDVLKSHLEDLKKQLEDI